ncbi:hypothetical protein [Sandarakinorhabdus sp.]|uniref:hypothetical protein n=1 Tax=Sandarakinorhabdus sp. TaxID=1916663 RepID=UPI00286D91AF|nr:hypothetical protein [Sandarakinorhabdus sp.]
MFHYLNPIQIPWGPTPKVTAGATWSKVIAWTTTPAVIDEHGVERRGEIFRVLSGKEDLIAAFVRRGNHERAEALRMSAGEADFSLDGLDDDVAHGDGSCGRNVPGVQPNPASGDGQGRPA